MSAGLHLGALARRLARCRRGVSALEFALAAPFLMLGTLAMTDIGRAVAARMELDRSVRAGTQAAVSLENEAPGIQAIVAVAMGGVGTATVTKQCECGGAAASCVTFCSPGVVPSVFFVIRAERPHPGALLAGGPLVSLARVQVR